MKLLLLLEATHGVGETGQGENQECRPLEQNRMEIADSDGGETQPIDLPGDGIQERGGTKPCGERRDGKKQRAREHSDKGEAAGDTLSEVVARGPSRKEHPEEKPTRPA